MATELWELGIIVPAVVFTLAFLYWVSMKRNQLNEARYQRTMATKVQTDLDFNAMTPTTRGIVMADLAAAGANGASNIEIGIHSGFTSQVGEPYETSNPRKYTPSYANATDLANVSFYGEAEYSADFSEDGVPNSDHFYETSVTKSKDYKTMDGILEE